MSLFPPTLCLYEITQMMKHAMFYHFFLWKILFFSFLLLWFNYHVLKIHRSCKVPTLSIKKGSLLFFLNRTVLFGFPLLLYQNHQIWLTLADPTSGENGLNLRSLHPYRITNTQRHIMKRFLKTSLILTAIQMHTTCFPGTLRLLCSFFALYKLKEKVIFR